MMIDTQNTPYVVYFASVIFLMVSSLSQLQSWCMVICRDKAKDGFWNMPGKTRAMLLLTKWMLMEGDLQVLQGATAGASASNVSVWHYIFPCFRRPGETTVSASVCVCAYVLGPSPEPMYYKSSRSKIIFGFSRPASNYYWHLIFFLTPFTVPFTPAPISPSLSFLSHTHTLKWSFWTESALFIGLSVAKYSGMGHTSKEGSD